MAETITRCPSCDGYGWMDEEGEVHDCDWCGGVGYVYHEDGADRTIPPADFATVGERLEQLEVERLREMGYTGAAKKPWEQAIRHGQLKDQDSTKSNKGTE